MNTKHALHLLQDGYTTIAVVFGHLGFDPYSNSAARPAHQPQPGVAPETIFKAKIDDKVIKGDTVVVEDFVHGMVCATVSRVDETPMIDTSSDYDYRWIVCKVDKKSYEAQLEVDSKFQAAMVQAERVQLREKVQSDYENALVEGSTAHKIFTQALTSMNQQINCTARGDIAEIGTVAEFDSFDACVDAEDFSGGGLAPADISQI